MPRTQDAQRGRVHCGLGPFLRDLLRIVELTQKYADLPIDFADVSLVAVGERLEIRQIATLDTHFHLYRMKDRTSFRNIFFR